MNILEKTEGVTFHYNKKTILNEVSIDVHRGEILGILGPNGCGKTTFLKHLNRNLSPDSGRITLMDSNLAELSKKEIAKIISSVPQGNEIRFSFTVREIVAMGRMPFQNQFSPESHTDTEIIDRAIERTGLEDFGDKYINELSGGERQRVIIARALAQTPDIMLLDEPTLHLDINNQFDILDLIHDLSRKENLTVVIVSHDLPMVARYCDRIILIKNHKVFAEGSVEDVLTAENMSEIFGVDAELTLDEKTGKYNVILHGSIRKKRRTEDSATIIHC